ncbi:hypothetical protein Tco_0218568 [Tanacetum coccineum]
MSSTVLVKAVVATQGVPAFNNHYNNETVLNMNSENKEHLSVEKRSNFHAFKLVIGDEISSTVDACIRDRQPVTPHLSQCLMKTSDLEQAQRDKDMQKNLALLAKYFKKLYKPTNNNLRTSSNSRNKTEDTAPRKPKRFKTTVSTRKKMMMCKQAEQGVPLQAEQADWLADMDEEIDE